MKESSCILCDRNSLLNHLMESEAISRNQLSYMTSSTRNSVIQDDGVNQFVVIYDLVKAALNIIM